MKTKKIDPKLTEALENLEKEFKEEYGQEPLYDEHSVGMHIFSLEITNSKNPVPFYRDSVVGAKIAALNAAIQSMVDE